MKVSNESIRQITSGAYPECRQFKRRLFLRRNTPNLIERNVSVNTLFRRTKK